MTSLLEGARELVTRSSDVGKRLGALEDVVAAGRGRLDDALLDEAQQIVDRASSRLRLSAEHTVIALGGSTGSGKSSTFNALTGLELSAVGVRRPTTSWASACVWGHEGADELLEWLGIPPRHHVTRDSMLDTGREDHSFEGVVLLDLPDHDSTDVSHHLEVDRLVVLADVLVWIVDPQKYADAALHDRYLKRFAGHSDVMVVVLNHIDTVPEDRREAMVADVRRLLAADGLPDVPVLGLSARQGINMEQLRAEISGRVASKKATRARLEADLKAAGQRLLEESGDKPPLPLTRDLTEELEEAFANAAGIPSVVEAVRESTVIRTRRITGWPLTSWVLRLRPDPMRRLHVDLHGQRKSLAREARKSVPETSPVQRARVDAAVREVADHVSDGLSRPWREAVRAASTARLDEVTERLDRVLTGGDLGARRLPWWAQPARVLQWLLFVTALAGGLWLAGLALEDELQLDLASPKWQDLPVPALMLGGGAAAGIALALVCRALAVLTAATRARRLNRRLHAGILELSRELVVHPVEEELAAYERVRSGLATLTK